MITLYKEVWPFSLIVLSYNNNYMYFNPYCLFWNGANTLLCLQYNKFTTNPKLSMHMLYPIITSLESMIKQSTLIENEI